MARRTKKAPATLTLLGAGPLGLIGMLFLWGASAPPAQTMGSCKECDPYMEDGEEKFRCIDVTKGSITCDAPGMASCSESGFCNTVESKQGHIRYSVGG